MKYVNVDVNFSWCQYAIVIDEIQLFFPIELILFSAALQCTDNVDCAMGRTFSPHPFYRVKNRVYLV